LVQDELVFVVSSSGFVYCLDADPTDGVDEGKEDSPGSTYDVIWTSREDPLVPYNVSPALVDGRLVLVSGPDSVLALNVSDGGQLWRARLPDASPLLMDVIAINDSVVVGGASLHILSAESGVETWNYDRPLGTLVGGPVALDGMLFVYDTKAIVYAFGKVENIPPVARIMQPLEDEAFRINESIVFDASISSDDKPLPDTSFFWNFGDGNTSFSKVISHRYTVDGIYRVELTVTDTDGEFDNASVTIRVLRNHRPTLDLEQVVPTQGIEELDLFNFSVRYTDPDNDPPEFIVIRLADEPGFQPINLLEVDEADMNYTDGKLYYLPKTLGSRPYPAVTMKASDGISITETVFAGPRVLVTKTFTNTAVNIEVTATYVGPDVLEFKSVVSPPTNFPTSLFPIGMYVELFLNTTYLKEASITISYQDFNITEFNVSTLSVYRWTVTDTETEWRYLPSVVDEENSRLTAEVLYLESDIYSVLGNKLKPPVNRKPIPVLFIDGREYTDGQTVDESYKPGDVVSFDASGSYDPDTTLYDRVIEWVWDFDDGTEPQVGKTAKHTFEHKGRYTVVLTLTDRFGGRNETRVTILVTSEDEDMTIFYIAIAAIIILMILLFYPKGGGRTQESRRAPSGKASEEPNDEEALDEEDDLDEGGGTGELDDILDELEEDRGQRKSRKS
jgi:PKD repeat protein